MPLKPHEQSYPTLSGDTDPAAEAIQLQIYRRMSPAQKVERIAEAWERSQQLALAGLRIRYPAARPEELRRRLYELLLGEELAARVYGPLK